MTEMNPWANIRKQAASLVPPLTIAKRQAHLLTEATEGVIQAFVETTKEGDRLRHRLYAMVPALDNYTVELGNIIHDEQLYPSVTDTPYRPEEPAIECSNHAALQEAFAGLMASEPVQRIVVSLMAQATASNS